MARLTESLIIEKSKENLEKLDNLQNIINYYQLKKEEIDSQLNILENAGQ